MCNKDSDHFFDNEDFAKKEPLVMNWNSSNHGQSIRDHVYILLIPLNPPKKAQVMKTHNCFLICSLGEC
jgi:hypothetical protein